MMVDIHIYSPAFGCQHKVLNFSHAQNTCEVHGMECAHHVIAFMVFCMGASKELPIPHLI